MTEIDRESVAALAPACAFSLGGRVALVTGAAGGIGSWLVAGLGAAGATVVATDVDAQRLDDACALAQASGVDAHSIAADLRDADAPEQLVAATVERFGSLDVLVNCAGINRREPLLEVTRESYDVILDVDLRVPYFLSQAAARRMLGQPNGGAIVNIGSATSAYALENVSVYGAAKAALTQLTQSMALEWSEHGIRVNCITPGFFDTPLAKPIWESPTTRQWILNRVPAARPGRPDELVGALQLLASDAASFITGQTIVVDGGFFAGGKWFTADVAPGAPGLS